MPIRKCLLILGAAGFLTLMGLTLAGVIGVAGRRAEFGQRPNNRFPAGLVNVQLPIADLPAPNAFLANPPAELAESDQELFNALAEQVAQIEPAPAHRKHHFAWIQDADVFLHGYSARILDIRESTFGYVVKLHVSPIITAGRKPGGTSATSFDFIHEQYQLTRGNWKYLGGEDAPGGHPGYLSD